MAISLDELIKSLHATPAQVVLAITGGGSRAISDLLAAPGASRTVLAAVVPYASAAMAEFLGGPPEKFCSEHTARMMAAAAWERGKAYLGDVATSATQDPSPSGRGKGVGKPNDEGALAPALSQREREMRMGLIGLGCTASLASDRPKRGEHRVHVAWHTAIATEVSSVVLKKGARTRNEEESIAALLILNALAAAMGIEQRLSVPLAVGEPMQTVHQQAPPQWTALVLGEATSASGRAHGAAVGGENEPSRTAIFPGAFHPPHEGHEAIMATGETLLGEPVALEISIHNVDKPPLDFIEIRRRLDALAGRPVWLTRAQTFVEKARIFPGATFLVGADTIARIADPKYYGGDERHMRQAIDMLVLAGCRFLVFGRQDHGKFETLANLALPSALERLCQQVPPEQFREDISSTEIRRSWME